MEKDKLSNFFQNYFENFNPLSPMSAPFIIRSIEANINDAYYEYSILCVDSFDEFSQLIDIIKDITLPSHTAIQKRFFLSEFFHYGKDPTIANKNKLINSQFLNEFAFLNLKKIFLDSEISSYLDLYSELDPLVKKSIQHLGEKKIEIPASILKIIKDKYPFLVNPTRFYALVSNKIVFPISLLLFFFKENNLESDTFWKKVSRNLNIFFANSILEEKCNANLNCYINFLQEKHYPEELLNSFPELYKFFRLNLNWEEVYANGLDRPLILKQHPLSEEQIIIFHYFCLAIFLFPNFIDKKFKSLLMRILNEVQGFYRNYYDILKLWENQIVNFQFSGNILKDKDLLNQIFFVFGKMNAILTNIEESNGVERYLSNIFVPEFKLIHKKMKIFIHNASKIIGTDLKLKYFNNWGNFLTKTIVDTILNIDSNTQTEVKNYLPLSIHAKNVILFVVDGLGSIQLWWYLQTLKNNLDIKQNVFDLFDKNSGTLKWNLISPFVPDTPPGLISIFLGLKPKDSSIFARHTVNLHPPPVFSKFSFNANIEDSGVSQQDIPSISIFRENKELNSFFLTTDPKLDIRKNQKSEKLIGSFGSKHPVFYEGQRNFFLKLSK